MIVSKPFSAIEKFLCKKRKLSKIETLEIDFESKELTKNKNNRYHIMCHKKYKKVF